MKRNDDRGFTPPTRVLGWRGLSEEATAVAGKPPARGWRAALTRNSVLAVIYEVHMMGDAPYMQHVSVSVHEMRRSGLIQRRPEPAEMRRVLVDFRLGDGWFRDDGPNPAGVAHIWRRV